MVEKDVFVSLRSRRVYRLGSKGSRSSPSPPVLGAGLDLLCESEQVFPRDSPKASIKRNLDPSIYGYLLQTSSTKSTPLRESGLEHQPLSRSPTMSGLESWEDDPSAQDENLSKQTQESLNLNGQANTFRPGANSFQPVSNINNTEAITSNMAMDNSKNTVAILSMHSKATINTTNNNSSSSSSSSSNHKACTARTMVDSLLHTTRGLAAFSRNSSRDKHP